MPHSRFMSIALSYAKRGVGLVAPNPSVGCVIVKSNQIIAAAVTAAGGRPHAETIALEQAGAAAKGATAYVTLEPCCHQGQTGPCAEALIAAGIATVVIAIEDPFPRVSGGGIARLKQAGIEVIIGICAEDARQVTEGFLMVQAQNRPYITLKLATSLDGKIATKSGKSQWITGPQARNYGHFLRAKNDAILVGIGTVMADDPMLTCRLPGLEAQSPIRVVVDSHLRMPSSCQLAKTAKETPCLVLTAGENSNASLADMGVEVIFCAADQGRVDLADAVQKLTARGITRLLVEGGSAIATAFIEAKLVDELVWMRSGHVFGNDALAALSDLTIDQIADAPYFKRVSLRMLGGDVVERLVRD